MSNNDESFHRVLNQKRNEINDLNQENLQLRQENHSLRKDLEFAKGKAFRRLKNPGMDQLLYSPVTDDPISSVREFNMKTNTLMFHEMVKLQVPDFDNENYKLSYNMVNLDKTAFRSVTYIQREFLQGFRDAQSPLNCFLEACEHAWQQMHHELIKYKSKPDSAKE